MQNKDNTDIHTIKTSPEEINYPLKRKFVFGVIIIIVPILGLLFTWIGFRISNQGKQETLEKARVIADQIILTRQLSCGDLSARVSLHTNDELEKLGKSFNLMAQSLMHNQNYLERTVTDPDHLEFIQIIEKNISRLTRLISNLFDFTKLEAGTIDWEFDRQDISQLVKEVIDIMSPLSLEKEIIILADCPEHLYAIIDLERMEQVLVNLLDNAIKFNSHQA